MKDSSGKEHSSKYVFSVIIAVYNTEKYLKEAIDSVLHQDFYTPKRVQIILVNDGSTDGSGSICKKYKELYPDSVTYLSQDNGGVSSARNAGLARATGKYVSFLDSDDKLSPDTLTRVNDFFDKHHNEIDVVSIKMCYFDATEGDHPTNYIYETTRIVDMFVEYDTPQLSTSSAFIKRDILRNRAFYEKLANYEDARLMTEILLEKMKYGVLSEPIYYYRRRVGEDSASAGAINKPSWYNDTLEYFSQYILDYSVNKFGELPKYVQYLLMYDLRGRFKQRDFDMLSARKVQLYKKKLIDILQSIDDEIIFKQRDFEIERKIFVLGKKHGKNIYKNANVIGKKAFFGDILLYNYHKSIQKVNIDLFNVQDDIMTIEGRMARGLLFDGVKLGFIVKGVFQEVVSQYRPTLTKVWAKEQVFDGNCFKINIPIKHGDSIVGVLQFPDGAVKNVDLDIQKASRLPAFYARSYRMIGKYLVSLHGKNEFVIVKHTPWRRFKKEIRHQAMASRLYRVLSKTRYPEQTQERHLSTALLRIAYFISIPFIAKKIWIISDKIDAAGDNGEAFFRYMQSQPHGGIKTYFSIDKKSDEYLRLKKYGHIINKRGWYYKLLYLHADKVIASHVGELNLNPFEYQYQYLCDLMKFDFVFLQHGITYNDVSKALNRWNYNISLIITAAKDEHEQFLSESYGYADNNVKLTGFPRYDYLEDNHERKLIIAPTWRSWLARHSEANDGLRAYNTDFKKSEYFKFYDKLIRETRIKELLKEYDMTGEFYIHPVLHRQSVDFSGDEQIKIISPPYDYKKAFCEGSIMVTDYSSVAFDFAYLKKPVVYTEFDSDLFYKSHGYSRGYFSSAENGFGPVTLDYESTVSAIAKIIKNGLSMQKKYLSRVDAFFAHTDKNNSQRVYEAIISMDKKG